MQGMRLPPWVALTQKELSCGSERSLLAESLLRREFWFGQTNKHHREPATSTEFLSSDCD